MKTNNADFLGVNLSDKQYVVALALAAGGTVTRIKEPTCKSIQHYITHPISGAYIDISNTTLRFLKKKLVIDEDLKFTQARMNF